VPVAGAAGVTRQRVLIASGVVLLLALLLAWSLAGAMTGIYSCPAATILDGSHGYLVRRGEAWYVVNINGNLGDRVQSLSPEHCTVEVGIWTSVVILREDGARISAYTPPNLFDVWALKWGDRRGLIAASVPTAP
jgi:hypothetical protein